MADNYYYLVAGLPDLVAGEVKKGFSFESTLSEILDELSPVDREQVKWLRYRYDNDNLMAQLEGKSDFDSRALFTEEELTEERQMPERLPAYMVTFLDAEKEGKELYAGLDKRETLALLYYENLLKSSSPFLSKWAALELTMNNVIAAATARKLGIPLEKSVLPLDETAERLLKSNANDFGLGGQFDWVEPVLSQFDDPITLEETIDRVRWDVAEECSAGYYFSIEVLLAFIIKLNSVTRWFKLDQEKGIARLNELLEGMKSAALAKSN